MGGSIRKNAVDVVGIVVCLIAVLVLLFMPVSPSGSSRETWLQNAFLTVASLALSAFVTRMYARWSYDEALRDSGVQIASAIFTLKRQMERLHSWVSAKRSEVRGVPANQIAIERADGILEHVSESMVNFDGLTTVALGGIRSVIGDAISQYERVRQGIAGTQAEAYLETQRIQKSLQYTRAPQDVAALQAEARAVEEMARRRVAALAKTSAIPISDAEATSLFSVACPHADCESQNDVSIRPGLGESAAARCQGCGRAFHVHFKRQGVVANCPGDTRRRPPLTKLHPTFQDDIKSFLVDRKAWVEPEVFWEIAGALVAAHRSLRETGPPTPTSLQNHLIAQVSDGRLRASAGAVRRLVNILYRSRVFTFSGTASFHEPYSNDLSEDSVVEGFLQGVVHRLGQAFEVSLDEAVELGSLILASRRPGDVEKVRANLSRQPLVQRNLDESETTRVQ